MRLDIPGLAALVALLTAACNSGGSSAESPAPALPPDVKTEETRYTAGGVTMKGYLAWDAAREGKRPGVLVVHEWWGHNEYARARARQLAAMGYVALAVDMFGDGKTADHPDDAGKFAGAVFADLDGARARFEAARQRLTEHPLADGSRVAAIGYCFGGGIVLHMARFGLDLRGVASFHGSLDTKTPAQPGEVTAAVLVCHGGADSFIPAKVVAAFKQEMTGAGVALDFVTYEGAKHGFTNPGATDLGKKFDLPIAYDERADTASWERLAKFLAGVFE